MQPSNPAVEAKIEMTRANDLALGAMVDGEQGDPNTAAHQHAGRRELGLLLCSVPSGTLHLLISLPRTLTQSITWLTPGQSGLISNVTSSEKPSPTIHSCLST